MTGLALRVLNVAMWTLARQASRTHGGEQVTLCKEFRDMHVTVVFEKNAACFLQWETELAEAHLGRL